MRILARTLSAAALNFFAVSSLFAEDVSMSFSGTTPPYVIVETKTGIELDIIREALSHRGHTLLPVFVPTGRINQMLASGQVDAASRDQGIVLDEAAYFRANKAVYFTDVMFTLTERHLELARPADLNGLSVVAFPDAARTYTKWLGAAATSELYREIGDQARQVKMLYAGRADVIVADRYIVRYLSLQLSRDGDVVLKPTQMWKFSEPWGYAPMFKSEQIRDDFNEGLRVLRERGRYAEIVAGYLRE